MFPIFIEELFFGNKNIAYVARERSRMIMKGALQFGIM